MNFIKEEIDLKPRDMILVALFAGLTVVGAYVSIPLPPVPVTFQNLMCILAGGILGSRKGAMSQIVYTLMGLVGLPVFAGGKGGFASIVSPTFGFIIGFIICAFIVGIFRDRNSEIKTSNLIIGSLIGTAVIYIIGTVYLYGIMNFVLAKPTTVMGAVKVEVLPFFVKDIIVAVVGALISKAVITKLSKAGYSNV